MGNEPVEWPLRLRQFAHDVDPPVCRLYLGREMAADVGLPRANDRRRHDDCIAALDKDAFQSGQALAVSQAGQTQGLTLAICVYGKTAPAYLRSAMSSGRVCDAA